MSHHSVVMTLCVIIHCDLEFYLYTKVWASWGIYLFLITYIFFSTYLLFRLKGAVPLVKSEGLGLVWAYCTWLWQRSWISAIKQHLLFAPAGMIQAAAVIDGFWRGNRWRMETPQTTLSSSTRGEDVRMVEALITLQASFFIYLFFYRRLTSTAASNHFKYVFNT